MIVEWLTSICRPSFEKISQSLFCSINGTLVTDHVIVANYFNDYFSSVADNLLRKIPTSSSYFYNCLSKSVGNSIVLKPTTPKEIKDVISTLKPKLSSGVDNI